MFYAHFVLSKKGPLARIWLAAHWDKKLTKAHVFETNIDSSVEEIIQPKVKMALRTSGHLLLGVVRIYSRKAKYLLADCNEAFVKIKMAFRPGVVDLPEENREAAVSTITLPENFHDFDTTMADLNDIDVQAQFSVNQSRPEEITMREDLGNITLVGDDGFGDMGFDDRAMMQDAHMDDTLYKNPDSSNILLDDTVDKSGADKPMDIDFDAPATNDGFGAGLDDFAMLTLALQNQKKKDENFMGDAGLFEEQPPVPEPTLAPEQPDPVAPPIPPPEVEGVPEDLPPPVLTREEDIIPPAPQEQTTVPDQTTLVHNEEEAFALEPLEVTNFGTERRGKRKRKLIVDEQKGIPSETMKLQLSDTSEIVTTLDLAPPTKKLMHWKETGGVEKLFALPGRHIVSKRIGRHFTNSLITRPIIDEAVDFGLEVEEEIQRNAAEDTYHEQPPLEPPSMVEDPSRIEQDSMAQPDMSVTINDTANISITIKRRRDTSIIKPLPEKEPEPPAPVAMPEPEPEIPEPEIPEPEPELPQLDEPTLRELNPSDDEEDNDGNDVFGLDLPSNEAQGQVEEEEGEELGEEEQEERRWNKRTQHLLHLVNKGVERQGESSFHGMCHRKNRKQVASMFYTLLVLKKQMSIEVEQNTPFGDITITKGPKYEVVY